MKAGTVFTAPDGKKFSSRAEMRDYTMEVYYSFRNKVNEDCMKLPGEIDGQVFEMSDSDNSTLVVMDTTNAVQIDKLKRCQVFIGVSSESIFIRDCTNCQFYICARQLRVRDCKNCDFYSYSQSEIHIELSDGLRFAPFLGGYPEQEKHFQSLGFDPKKNMWNCVYDHNDGEGSHPHWSLIEESIWAEEWFPNGARTAQFISRAKFSSDHAGNGNESSFKDRNGAGDISSEGQVGDSFSLEQMIADSQRLQQQEAVRSSSGNKKGASNTKPMKELYSERREEKSVKNTRPVLPRALSDKDCAKKLGMEVALLIASAVGKSIDVSLWMNYARDTGLLAGQEFDSKLAGLAAKVGLNEDQETKDELDLAISRPSLRNIHELCGRENAPHDPADEVAMYVDVPKFLRICQLKVDTYLSDMDGSATTVGAGGAGANDDDFEPGGVVAGGVSSSSAVSFSTNASNIFAEGSIDSASDVDSSSAYPVQDSRGDRSDRGRNAQSSVTLSATTPAASSTMPAAGIAGMTVEEYIQDLKSKADPEIQRPVSAAPGDRYRLEGAGISADAYGHEDRGENEGDDEDEYSEDDQLEEDPEEELPRAASAMPQKHDPVLPQEQQQKQTAAASSPYDEEVSFNLSEEEEIDSAYVSARRGKAAPQRTQQGATRGAAGGTAGGAEARISRTRGGTEDAEYWAQVNRNYLASSQPMHSRYSDEEDMLRVADRIHALEQQREQQDLQRQKQQQHLHHHHHVASGKHNNDNIKNSSTSAQRERERERHGSTRGGGIVGMGTGISAQNSVNSIEQRKQAHKDELEEAKLKVEALVRNAVKKPDMYHLVQIHLGFVKPYTMMPPRGSIVASRPRQWLTNRDLQTAFLAGRLSLNNTQLMVLKSLVNAFARDYEDLYAPEKRGKKQQQVSGNGGYFADVPDLDVKSGATSKNADEPGRLQGNAAEVGIDGVEGFLKPANFKTPVFGPHAVLSAVWLQRYLVHLRLSKRVPKSGTRKASAVSNTRHSLGPFAVEILPFSTERFAPKNAALNASLEKYIGADGKESRNSSPYRSNRKKQRAASTGRMGMGPENSRHRHSTGGGGRVGGSSSRGVNITGSTLESRDDAFLALSQRDGRVSGGNGAFPLWSHAGSLSARRLSADEAEEAELTAPMLWQEWLGLKIKSGVTRGVSNTEEFAKALRGERYRLSRDDVNYMIARRGVSKETAVLPFDCLKRLIACRVKCWELDADGRRDLHTLFRKALNRKLKLENREWKSIPLGEQKDMKVGIRTQLLKNKTEQLFAAEKSTNAITIELFWKFHAKRKEDGYAMPLSWLDWLSNMYLPRFEQDVADLRREKIQRQKLLRRDVTQRKYVAGLNEIEQKLGMLAGTMAQTSQIELRKALVQLRRDARENGLAQGNVVTKQDFDRRVSSVLAPYLSAGVGSTGVGGGAGTGADLPMNVVWSKDNASLRDRVSELFYPQLDEAVQAVIAVEEQRERAKEEGFREWLEKKRVETRARKREEAEQKKEQKRAEKEKRTESKKAVRQWKKLRRANAYMSYMDKKAYPLPRSHPAQHDRRWFYEPEPQS